MTEGETGRLPVFIVTEDSIHQRRAGHEGQAVAHKGDCSGEDSRKDTHYGSSDSHRAACLKTRSSSRAHSGVTSVRYMRYSREATWQSLVLHGTWKVRAWAQRSRVPQCSPSIHLSGRVLANNSTGFWPVIFIYIGRMTDQSIERIAGTTGINHLTNRLKV